MLSAKNNEELGRIRAIIGKRCAIDDISLTGITLSGTLSFETMSLIVDFLRVGDYDREEFERCWLAYRRKGSKAKAVEFWRKLSADEQSRVMPHIKAYVSSRTIKFQKDFERYLRDKVFDNVVFDDKGIAVFDPTKGDDSHDVAYMPVCGCSLSWNDYLNCFMYTGFFNGVIYDGYTDDNRPDGASVVLNNSRGTAVWSAAEKRWEVRR